MTFEMWNANTRPWFEKGGLDESEGEEGSETGLSAYVLISLLESGAVVDAKVIESALQCLKSNQKPSTYTLALTTYAFVLAKEKDLGGVYMDKLLQRATEKDGLLYWHASPDGRNVVFLRFPNETLANNLLITKVTSQRLRSEIILVHPTNIFPHRIRI